MKRLHIVAGIILNPDKSQVFITKRHKDAHQGGLWEFPGGKVEPDEQPKEGLIRELYEEIGIKVTELSHFEYLVHDYPDKSLEFDFFIISRFLNQPYGKEGQQGRWVSISELAELSFPEANIPVLKKFIKLHS